MKKGREFLLVPLFPAKFEAVPAILTISLLTFIDRAWPQNRLVNRLGINLLCCNRMCGHYGC